MNHIRRTALAVFVSTWAIAAQAQTPGPSPAPPPAGPVTVVTILDVVPNYAMANNVEASTALLDKLAADTQGSPGLVSFKVMRDPGRGNHFLMVGVWNDVKSFDAYTGAESTRAFRQAFAPRQGGPFDERMYVSLK